jgi:DNA-directed RNA polymerase specialized sigma24 family protein
MRDRKPPLILVAGGNTPLEKAVAAKFIDDMNLLRLKAAARFLARGLSPEIYWWDLLQEAFARVLNGSRHCPAGVPVDVFMTGVMRSIRAEHWRRKTLLDTSVPLREAEISDPAPDPERVVLHSSSWRRLENSLRTTPWPPTSSPDWETDCRQRRFVPSTVCPTQSTTPRESA